MSEPTLLDEFQALLERRPAFHPALAPYEHILAAWSAWTPPPTPPHAPDRETCQRAWRDGLPIAAQHPPLIAREEVEALFDAVIDALEATGGEPDPLARFAAAWDDGRVGPGTFLPARGRIGAPSLETELGLSPDVAAILALGGLRPALEAHLSACRAHLTPGSWRLGICPLCGAPPAFADILEDGQRHLACHLCGTAWTFPRLACPYCGNETADRLVKLLAEREEEGYAILACTACQGYVKELDRRARWNVGPSLIEDWGTPHLDLMARQAGYWRAIPTLLHARPARPAGSE